MSILTGGHTGSGSASNNPWAAPNANSASSLTWYYYHDTKTFASGPKLLLGRRYHGSATIVDKSLDHVISTGCQMTHLVSNLEYLLLLCFSTADKFWGKINSAKNENKHSKLDTEFVIWRPCWNDMICTQVTNAKIPIVTAGYHHTFLSSTELLIDGMWRPGNWMQKAKSFDLQ